MFFGRGELKFTNRRPPFTLNSRPAFIITPFEFDVAQNDRGDRR
jgi:hypothetical protein